MEFPAPGTSVVFSDSGLNYVPFEAGLDMDREDLQELCEHLQIVVGERTGLRVTFNVTETNNRE